MSVASPLEIIEQVIPFKFLDRDVRQRLADDLERRTYASGEYLIRTGDTTSEVFLIAHGQVETIDETRVPPAVLSVIDAGHYLGERAALFEGGRQVGVRAKGPVVVYTMAGKRFLELLACPTFAQALAEILRVKQGIFRSYRGLYTRLLTLIEKREFLLSELLDTYQTLEPALHPDINSERLDLGALEYAVPRLPDDVTETSLYFLTTVLPPLYQRPDTKFVAVRTAARRRSAWKALPGKTIVQIRDGISDITDLVTCLCAYAVEARKIRRRHTHSGLLEALHDLPAVVGDEKRRQLLEIAQLDPDEVAALERLWGDRLWYHVRNILLHHEDVAIECDLQPDNYNSSAAEEWVTQIRARASEMVDVDDPELEVHIISSNTHSVGNCLSPYLAAHADVIMAWGREHHPELETGTLWNNPRDLAYQYARLYFRDHPDERDAADRAERDAGRCRLRSTAYTGIEVDLFDVRRLRVDAVDPWIQASLPVNPTLIVNVDYAFGQQAEHLLASLLCLFGSRVRSVNVMGKAGGLVGRRGDLLLPQATLLQTNDELYALSNQDLPRAELERCASDRVVHEGPVLTVAGTLLQDRTLLNFYRRIWGCVGLEMEGSFFARKLQAARLTGVVGPDVVTRFAYYVSDLPMNADSNLSEAMAPGEGTPPLYAITRVILDRILAAR